MSQWNSGKSTPFSEIRPQNVELQDQILKAETSVTTVNEMLRSQTCKWGEKQIRKKRYNRDILPPRSIMGAKGGGQYDRSNWASGQKQREGDCTEGWSWKEAKAGGGEESKERDAGALQFQLEPQVSWKSFSSVRRLCSAMCIWFSKSYKKKKEKKKT